MNDKKLAERIRLDRVRYKYRELVASIVRQAIAGHPLSEKQRKVLLISYNQSLGLSPSKTWNQYRNLDPIGGFR